MSGELVASAGAPDAFIYLRSSAKPFQLAPFVASGRFDSYDLGDEALAIMAASHSGEDRHVRTVQEILRRGGVSAAALQNQVHAPYDSETARRMVRSETVSTSGRRRRLRMPYTPEYAITTDAHPIAESRSGDDHSAATSTSALEALASIIQGR